MRSLFFLLCFYSLALQAQEIQLHTLDSILNTKTEKVQRIQNTWQFEIDQTLLICITDTTANRMRIMSPIVSIKQILPEQIIHAMTANFHTALDVRYAISDGVLWSVFTHPWRPLTTSQFSDAVAQVLQANKTFGTSYSSTTIGFPPPKAKKDTAKRKESKPILKI